MFNQITNRTCNTLGCSKSAKYQSVNQAVLLCKDCWETSLGKTTKQDIKFKRNHGRKQYNNK